MAAVCAAMIPISLCLVPLTIEELSVPAVSALSAALAFYRGLQERRYRHSRLRAVMELRAGMHGESDVQVSG